MSQTFQVPAAQRTGTFSSPTITWPGGEQTIFWQLNIPNQSEYEDTANSVSTSLIVDGQTWSTAVWPGGRQIGKDGVTVDPPPAQQFNVSGLQAGQQVSVECVVTGTFTVGIQNGLISP